MGNNGWEEWSKYILKELERLNKNIEGIVKAHNDCAMRTARELAVIRTRASIFGALAGAVPAVIMLVVWLVRG